MRHPFLTDEPGGDVDIEITADGLCFVNEGGRSATLPFSRIREVRLFCEMSEPSRIFTGDDGFAVFFCELRLADRQCITLASALAGQDRYRDFVQLLHKCLVPIRRRIRFRAGMKWSRFFSWYFWAHLSLDSFPWLWIPIFEEERLTFRRNRPRRYRPDRIPDVLLPDVGTISPP